MIVMHNSGEQHKKFVAARKMFLGKMSAAEIKLPKKESQSKLQ